MIKVERNDGPVLHCVANDVRQPCETCGRADFVVDIERASGVRGAQGSLVPLCRFHAVELLCRLQKALYGFAVVVDVQPCPACVGTGAGPAVAPDGACLVCKGTGRQVECPSCQGSGRGNFIEGVTLEGLSGPCPHCQGTGRQRAVEPKGTLCPVCFGSGRVEQGGGSHVCRSCNGRGRL